jgi:hypothetical protein
MLEKIAAETYYANEMVKRCTYRAMVMANASPLPYPAAPCRKNLLRGK